MDGEMSFLAWQRSDIFLGFVALRDRDEFLFDVISTVCRSKCLCHTSESVLLVLCRDNGYLSVRDPAGGANLVDEKTVTRSQAGPFTFTLAETQFSVLEEPTTLEPKTTPESP
mmetsp:Transcript_51282/g.111520  ORF Transcript_51282/g.111520 Transcript_51282/m.111520 type:complete len:113 (-) Transcript_51282:340-678(-)